MVDVFLLVGGVCCPHISTVSVLVEQSRSVAARPSEQYQRGRLLADHHHDLLTAVDAVVVRV